MKNATLIFLTKKSATGKISDVCLAMKKRGFGLGRWNGTGGKVTNEETIENAARRETKEEIGIDAKDISKVAELSFGFVNNPSWNQTVHVYFCSEWTGEPTESEEMSPKWFPVPEIPYSSMWPDDIFWLPRVIAGEKIKASFTFGDGDKILAQNVLGSCESSKINSKDFFTSSERKA
jgi:8-oxo-dGTP pyrophosphatase MutT (NUDIX family)